MQPLILLFLILSEFETSHAGPAGPIGGFNPQPDPPAAPPTPPDDTGLHGPWDCSHISCPPPALCKMIIPPGGSTYQPTCVCPQYQIWSDCPSCIITCSDLLNGNVCDENICYDAQCICPGERLFDKFGKCVPSVKCTL